MTHLSLFTGIGGLDLVTEWGFQSAGNAVVPQQFYPVFRAIMEIERGIPRGHVHDRL